MSCSYNEEKKKITSVLIENSVPGDQADIVADCLTTADLYGVKTHGVSVLPAHVERIKQGAYNLNPKFKIMRQTAAFAVIDGDNAMGPVSADYCMRYAIQKSSDSGLFTVFSRNNNTFGPAFYYPLKAAQQGKIGFICSNSPAQMAPMGGIEKMLGTNPFSAVIPVPGDDPIIIDMATSIVAKSKFKEYKAAGKKLPEGWALDCKGNPTTNPDEAMQGLVLPMAGFKGYAIAMLIDILSGLMSGAAYLNHVGRFYSQDGKSMNVGFYMMVIDPEKVYGNDYADLFVKYVEELRQSKGRDECKIVLPGDDRNKAKNDNMEE